MMGTPDETTQRILLELEGLEARITAIATLLTSDYVITDDLLHRFQTAQLNLVTTTHEVTLDLKEADDPEGQDRPAPGAESNSDEADVGQEAAEHGQPGTGGD